MSYDYAVEKTNLFLTSNNLVKGCKMLLHMHNIITDLFDKAGVCTVHKALCLLEIGTSASLFERLTCIDMLVETNCIIKVSTVNGLQIIMPGPRGELL